MADFETTTVLEEEAMETLEQVELESATGKESVVEQKPTIAERWMVTLRLELPDPTLK